MQPIASSLTRSEQVYVAIRDSICDGTLPAGTHLVQETLATRLGVSRQPVQQAMALLKSDGLVLERSARGLYVAPLDEQATSHRYQIREGLDRLAARLAAGRAAKEAGFADELRSEGARLLEQGDTAVAQGLYREAVACDVAFHNFLYERSGNPLIATTAEPLWHMLRRVMLTVLSYAERGPIVWAQHREIVEVIASGDADAAMELVTAHIRGAETAIGGAFGDPALGRLEE